MSPYMDMTMSRDVSMSDLKIRNSNIEIPACGRQARTMKIDNPPSPPFSKGGMGGFESYFLSNPKSQCPNDQKFLIV